MPAVDRLVCLSDIVGYGPWPAEVVNIVRDHADLTMKGNHDRYVYRPDSAAGELNEQAVAGIRYAADQLADDQKNWLLSLHDRSDVFNEFLAVHSHPSHLDRYVRPEEFPTMREHLDDFRGLLLGHTHIQHMDDRLIVNPGAVGQPWDGDPRAADALVDTKVTGEGER